MWDGGGYGGGAKAQGGAQAGGNGRRGRAQHVAGASRHLRCRWVAAAAAGRSRGELLASSCAVRSACRPRPGMSALQTPEEATAPVLVTGTALGGAALGGAAAAPAAPAPATATDFTSGVFAAGGGAGQLTNTYQPSVANALSSNDLLVRVYAVQGCGPAAGTARHTREGGNVSRVRFSCSSLSAPEPGPEPGTLRLARHSSNPAVRLARSARPPRMLSSHAHTHWQPPVPRRRIGCSSR